MSAGPNVTVHHDGPIATVTLSRPEYRNSLSDDMLRELIQALTALRDDARASLSKNAEYLRRWDSTRITIEGHADERGTPEYNLALGERRAAAVRDYLTSLGIAADRVATVSKGKEAPFCTESNEACWQQNRRGHFVFTAK